MEVKYANGIPMIDAYEVTFVNRKNYRLEDVDVELPIDIDQPCNPDRDEVRLKRWNRYFEE